MGASNAGGVGKSRDSRQYLALGSMTARMRATIATIQCAVYLTDGDTSVNLVYNSLQHG